MIKQKVTKAIFTLTLFFTGSVFAEVSSFPKTLNINEIKAHFIQYREILALQDDREFTFNINGRNADRECEECYSNGTEPGSIIYKAADNQICMEWNVIHPESGCFHLVQTGSREFELRAVRSYTTIYYTVPTKPRLVSEFLDPNGIPAVKFGRTILADLSATKPTEKKLKAAIYQALIGRGWQVEKYRDPKIIVASLVKASRVYKVMLRYNEPWLAIGFALNHEPRGNSWLRYLKNDTLRHLSVP